MSLFHTIRSPILTCLPSLVEFGEGNPERVTVFAVKIWNAATAPSILRALGIAIIGMFDGRSGQPSWVAESNIGNHILFLNRLTAFFVQPIAGFKGNCVYYFGDRSRTPCRYDITTGTVSRVPCPFEHCTWFLPSLL